MEYDEGDVKMLSFIYGIPSSGKREEIYKRAGIDAEKGKNVYILVPEQYSMYTEQALLSRFGMSGQSKIQVLTFSRLCNLIFSRKGPLRTQYVDKAGKYMLARKAMQSVENQLTLLRANVYQHGFAKLAVSTISEFKRYGVSPSRLREAAENAADARLAMKLRDLSTIYERFNTITEESRCNSEDNLTIAISRISGCDFLKGSIYIDFFRSFTPIEYDALKELMKIADLCVALCTDTLSDDASVFFSQVNVYRHLREIAKDNGVAIGKDTYLQNNVQSGISPELIHIRDNYFASVPITMTR